MDFRLKIKSAVAVWKSHGWKALRHNLAFDLNNLAQRASYRRWIQRCNTFTDEKRDLIRADIGSFPRKPLISIILPVFNVEEKWLRLCIDSVLKQIYPRWELCIADDASTLPHVKHVLDEYAASDDRIKIVYRTANGHISAASNSALTLANGEFCALLDHDDELSEDALYFIAKEINDFPKVEMIYSDEDLISDKGQRHSPKFKPDWSRDLFYSGNLITHLSAFKTELLRRIGGFTVGLEGSQDYDLGLRVIEEIQENHIRHIPKILYHWRVIESSVSAEGDAKPYAHENARKAIRAHLERSGKKADVVRTVYNLHRVRYRLPEQPPLVSIVMAFEGCSGEVDEQMILIAEKTGYPNFEIIAICHDAQTGSAVGAGRNVEAGAIATEVAVSVTRSEAGRLNEGATSANGEILCFVDPELVPDSPDWLEELVGFVIQDEIGAVGAKLLYPNDTIMQGGLLLGVGGTVGIAHHKWQQDKDGNITRMRLIGNYLAVSVQCMAVRRDVFKKAGMFAANRFPDHLFDADFCLRLRDIDKRVVWTPYSLLRTSDLSNKNERYFCPSAVEKNNFEQDWGPFIDRDPFYNPNLSRSSADFFVRTEACSETKDSN